VLRPAHPNTPAGAYLAWAKGEPNNRFSPEFCGVADLMRMSRGAGGWADENCMQHNIYMCRATRETCRDQLPLRAH
jgi:hypothetical protein